MNNIDDVIKRYNLFFTNTLDRNTSGSHIDNIDEIRVNYNGCISLYSLIEKFNKLYVSFRKDYEKIKKLKLGAHVYILDFNKNSVLNSRDLLIYIDKPTITNEKDTFLHLSESCGNILSYVTDGMNVYDKRYYKKVDLDKEKVREYINLFDKYSILLKLYYHFKKGVIFADGMHTMRSKIIDEKDNFLSKFDEFIIKIGSIYDDTSSIITMSVNLGDEFGINKEKCKIELSGQNINASDEDYEKLLKNIYINSKYLDLQRDQYLQMDQINIRKK